VELFAYLRKNTDADSVLVGIKPRALALFTDRCVWPNHYPGTNDIWPFLADIDARYIVVFPDIDGQYWSEFASRYADHVCRTFDNGKYTVYRITWRKDEPGVDLLGSSADCVITRPGRSGA